VIRICIGPFNSEVNLPTNVKVHRRQGLDNTRNTDPDDVEDVRMLLQEQENVTVT
jgi:hypothetical protein